MCQNDEQLEAYQATIEEQRAELDILRIEVMLLQSKLAYGQAQQEHQQRCVLPAIQSGFVERIVHEDRIALHEFLEHGSQYP